MAVWLAVSVAVMIPKLPLLVISPQQSQAGRGATDLPLM